MTLPVWPTSLPQFVNEGGYSEELIDGSTRTPMETGVMKVRRRFTGKFTRIACSIDMDETQFGTFKDFFADTLAHGSLPFTWVYPGTSTAATMRFMGPYRASVFGAINYRVGMQLEAR